MDFSNRIKEARKAVKMSQTELGDRLKLNQATISGWELGKFQPGLDDLLRLCELFCVTPNELLGYGDAPVSVTPAVPDLAGPYLCYSDNEKVPLTKDEEYYLMRCLITARDGQKNAAELNKFSGSSEKKFETA